MDSYVFFCTSLAAVSINDVLKLPNFNQNGPAKLAVAGFVICILLSTFIYGIATYGISMPAQAAGAADLAAGTRGNDKKSYEINLLKMSIGTVITTTIIVVFSRISLGVVE